MAVFIVATLACIVYCTNWLGTSYLIYLSSCVYGQYNTCLHGEHKLVAIANRHKSPRDK